MALSPAITRRVSIIAVPAEPYPFTRYTIPMTMKRTPAAL